MKKEKLSFPEDKQILTSATLKLLEEVVEMAPQVGVHITPRFQSALAMVLTGRSYKQAASTLGVSQASVSAFAHQAVEELKQLPELMTLRIKELRQIPEVMARIIEEVKPCVEEMKSGEEEEIPCEEEVEEPSSSDAVETEHRGIQYDTKIRDLPGAKGCFAVMVLEEAGIMTVGDLCSRNRREIANIPRMRLRMHSIDTILEDAGFWYSMR